MKPSPSPINPQSDPRESSALPAPDLEVKISAVAERRARDNRIIDLMQQRWPYKKIAKYLGCTENIVTGVVYRWRKQQKV